MIRSIHIPGEPVSKGRPRSTRDGRHYTPKRTADYERRVRFAWLEAHPGQRPWPAGVPLRAQVDAFFALPAGASKAERTHHAIPRYLGAREDADNLAKAVMDALNGVAWEDDRQIACLQVRKFRTAETEGVTLHVTDEFPETD